MENLNVRNVQVEGLKSIPPYRREPYSKNDKLNFERIHKKPINGDKLHQLHWDQLQERFDESAKIEEELRGLENEKRKLVEKGDELQKRLSEVQKRLTNSPEEEEKKQQEIESIQDEIEKNYKEIKKVREDIKEKEQGFLRAIDKVEEAKEIVRNDEHEQNQLDDEEYRR